MSNENLEALQSALAAVQASLKILQEAGDQEGVIKASRAISDIGSKIAKLQPSDPQISSPDRKRAEKEFLDALLSVVEGDAQERRDTAASLRTAIVGYGLQDQEVYPYEGSLYMDTEEWEER